MLTSTFERIEAFDPPDLSVPPAVALDEIRERTPSFKEWFRTTGTVDLFAARSLVTLPYPSRYALWEAAPVWAPYVWFTNRVFVVRWREGNRVRTMLAEPSDYELGTGTPYIVRRLRLAERAITRHGTVLGHLAALGITAEEIDYLVFDHLHTQDVRRLIGTIVPQPDLGGEIYAMFPNATLFVQRDELDHVEHAHPFQARFHQPETYRDIDRSRLTVLDGDVLIGPGVALLRAPGHTLGNMTIAINTPSGIVCSSENGVAVDSWAPEHSRIPGLRRWARDNGMEVVLNFNTPEYASWQYNAMVRERLLADRIPGRPDLPMVIPSSELAPNRLAPFIRPAHRFGDRTVTS